MAKKKTRSRKIDKKGFHKDWRIFLGVVAVILIVSSFSSAEGFSKIKRPTPTPTPCAFVDPSIDEIEGRVKCEKYLNYSSCSRSACSKKLSGTCSKLPSPLCEKVQYQYQCCFRTAPTPTPNEEPCLFIDPSIDELEGRLKCNRYSDYNSCKRSSCSKRLGGSCTNIPGKLCDNPNAKYQCCNWTTPTPTPNRYKRFFLF